MATDSIDLVARKPFPNMQDMVSNVHVDTEWIG